MVLLAGSLIFYALGDPDYLALLMASVLVNYFFGLHLGQGARRRGKKKQKRLFFIAAACNLGVLVLAKSGVMGGSLPVGISFYTFQILSYLIDVYRREEERETSFVRLAAYITMFPQLVSGPIVAYNEVRSDLRQREFTAEGVQEGQKLFTVGLVLKVLLADRIGLLWREVQTAGFASISTPLAWIAAVAYSLKIYFDFFGYSLMAVGLGKALGFTLPENFRNPYMARSVRDFYRRWHITLGRWFCKYVYIPLGGNRRGEFRTVCNLLAVWFLTSIWHGSTANFLIWGMLLWLLIVMERQLEARGIFKLFEKRGLRFLPHLYLWAVIPVTWMCFAITDTSELQVYLNRMFGMAAGIRVNAGDWIKALKDYGYLFAAGFFACTPGLQKLYRKGKDTLPGMFLLAALFWLCVRRLQAEGQNPFMYRWF